MLFFLAFDLLVCLSWGMRYVCKISWSTWRIFHNSGNLWALDILINLYLIWKRHTSDLGVQSESLLWDNTQKNKEEMVWLAIPSLKAGQRNSALKPYTFFPCVLRKKKSEGKKKVSACKTSNQTLWLYSLPRCLRFKNNHQKTSHWQWCCVDQKGKIVDGFFHPEIMWTARMPWGVQR